MKIKLIPDITINIVRTIDIGKNHSGGIDIHHRDAKRILQHKAWNSRKIHYDGDSYVAVYIQEFFCDEEGIRYLLHLEDKRNGETRVTPMYEIEFVKHSHRVGHKNYIVFKKK